ncbi:MAG: hypothetical protein QOJ63_1094 [Solirubrobacteraceae bacterium]|nr:hypothetical protein [Solirubrobacteraceae bacterium]
MNVLNAFKKPRRRAAILALVLTGALGATALAAVSNLTLDPTAALSPGRLHATLTGKVTCDPGDNVFMNGQIVQPKNTSGFGSTQAVCDGTSHPYAIDVAIGGFFPGSSSGVFKAGKANAQVSMFTCDPFAPICTPKYTDAVIRLTK